MDLQKIYKCEICDKNYKHRQSLYKHKNKFHPESQPKNNSWVASGCPKVNIKMLPVSHNNEDGKGIFFCKFCNKKFLHKQSKYRHEKKCKENLIVKNQILEKENQELKEMFENEILILKEQLLDSINKNCKMHPKTLQKINRQLNNQYNNNQNNTNCIVNNNTINIIPLGQEKLSDILSSKEQKMILSKKQQSLNYLIEYVHFNEKYPQFQNIIVTNLKDNIAYKYDDNKKKFMATTKDELLEILMENRIIDIEDFYNFNSDKLNDNTNKVLNNFINKIKNDDLYFDKKKSDIKLILYNNSDNQKILK